MNKLLQIRKGGNVKRFHTTTTIREHLVSSHSWGVATLILDICQNPSIELIKAALYHDVAEHVTGDINAVTKWRYPELSSVLKAVEQEVEKELGVSIVLTPNETLILKFADMCDLVLCCVEEVRLGNVDAADIVRRGLTYLEDRTWTHECREYLPQVKRYVKEMANV